MSPTWAGDRPNFLGRGRNKSAAFGSMTLYKPFPDSDFYRFGRTGSITNLEVLFQAAQANISATTLMRSRRAEATQRPPWQ